MDLLNQMGVGVLHYTSLADIVLRLGVAAFCGLVIGIDREIRGKPAGLRTCMLVAIASATFVIAAFELTYSAEWLSDNVRPDPLRVFEAVITGVSFLGAGAIIRSGAEVYGMTTGAAIWLVGALGLIAGAGLLLLSLIVLSIGALVLTVLGYVDRKLES